MIKILEDECVPRRSYIMIHEEESTAGLASFEGILNSRLTRDNPGSPETTPTHPRQPRLTRDNAGDDTANSNGKHDDEASCGDRIHGFFESESEKKEILNQ